MGGGVDAWQSFFSTATAFIVTVSARQIAGQLILGLARIQDDWHFAPTDDTPLPAGHELVFIEGPEVRRRLEELCSPLA